MKSIAKIEYKMVNRRYEKRNKASVQGVDKQKVNFTEGSKDTNVNPVDAIIPEGSVIPRIILNHEQ